MTGHGATFERKKEDAIMALLAHRSIEEAATAAGTSAKTLHRWLKEPEFDTAYRAAKRVAFGQAIARLHQGSSAAATTLLKLMLDPATPPPSHQNTSNRPHAGGVSRERVAMEKR
jgi:hypothetical protein